MLWPFARQHPYESAVARAATQFALTVRNFKGGLALARTRFEGAIHRVGLERLHTDRSVPIAA